MAENEDNCSVGKLTKTSCHLSSFTKKKDLFQLNQLSKDDMSLLKYRIDKYYTIADGTICDHHRHSYLTYYSQFIYKCCDPFNKHKSNVTNDLRIIKIDFCEIVLTKLKLKLIPGNKICKRCQSSLKEKLGLEQEEESTIDVAGTSTDKECPIDVADTSTDKKGRRRLDRIAKQDVSYVTPNVEEGYSQKSNFSNSSSEFFTLSQGQRELNTILTDLEMPSLENHQVFKTRRINDANSSVHDVAKNFAKKCSTALDISFTIPEPVSRTVIEDSAILQQMIINLKNLFEKTTTTNQKLKYLALPSDWNYHMICQYFECTKYVYEKLCLFRKMDGKLKF